MADQLPIDPNKDYHAYTVTGSSYVVSGEALASSLSASYLPRFIDAEAIVRESWGIERRRVKIALVHIVAFEEKPE